jgi:hypothetical protein
MPPILKPLPPDSAGHPRFYIITPYSQSAGGTMGEQTTVWIWNGARALPIAGRDYAVDIDQSVGTRVEGDVLKVRMKRFFRTFFSCGMCEERQADWMVRIAPDGVQILGDVSAVPELDAIDELFYRMIKSRTTSDIASAAARKNAQTIINIAISDETPERRHRFPSLGMMGSWSVDSSSQQGRKVICFSADNIEPQLFTLVPRPKGFFISEIKPAGKPCDRPSVR